MIYEEEGIALISVGHMFEEAEKTRRAIKRSAITAALSTQGL